MGNLKIKMLPIGWVRYPDNGNEKVFIMPVQEKVIKARVQLNPFLGTVQQVQEEVEKRVAGLGVLGVERAAFTMNNINWGVSYYVLKAAEEKYRALVYAALDGSYLLFDLSTEDSLMQMRLFPEAKRLISCVDYSCIKHDNVFLYRGKAISVLTPESFRFNSLSGSSCLIFLSESGYLFVNVPTGGKELQEFVSEQLTLSYLGVWDCMIEEDSSGVAESGIQWLRYRAFGSDGAIGFGTYFRQGLAGEFVTSFLYEEQKPTVNLTGFLRCREEA